MVQQLNVFVENRPGRLKMITGILSEAGINIRAIEIQDREDFGIVKLLVDDPEQARLVLAEQGLAVAVKDILAIAIEDRPGGLYRLAELLERKAVNQVDAYGFVVDARNEAVWCVEVEDPEQVARLVTEHGFRVLDAQEMYQM